MALSAVQRLVAFVSRPRPTSPESLPTFMDGEFRRLSDHSKALVAAIQDLDARLKSAGH